MVRGDAFVGRALTTAMSSGGLNKNFSEQFLINSNFTCAERDGLKIFVDISAVTAGEFTFPVFLPQPNFNFNYF
ncbi:MAG TPA: hypothetical protein VF556_13735 [Pyrinomonadaceae bacterium]|jgi:hypothetical protein